MGIEESLDRNPHGSVGSIPRFRRAERSSRGLCGHLGLWGFLLAARRSRFSTLGRAMAGPDDSDQSTLAQAYGIGQAGSLVCLVGGVGTQLRFNRGPAAPKADEKRRPA